MNKCKSASERHDLIKETGFKNKQANKKTYPNH